MTTIRMSEAEARRSGLMKTGPTKRRAGGGRRGATSRCSCGETFTSDTAEERHMMAEGHHRFETVCDAE